MSAILPKKCIKDCAATLVNGISISARSDIIRRWCDIFAAPFPGVHEGVRPGSLRSQTMYGSGSSLRKQNRAGHSECGAKALMLLDRFGAVVSECALVSLKVLPDFDSSAGVRML